MRYLGLAVFLIVLSAATTPALAQQPPSNGGRTALWTSVGAGAGFGIGLWAGLTAFDDAIDSDRKVWTSAIVGAAVGGTLAYVLTRTRRQSSPSRRTPDARFTDRDVAWLAASTRLRR